MFVSCSLLVFHLFRFQDQRNLFNFKPSEFKKALEEAVLAENGNFGDAEIISPDSSATESDQDYGPASRFQARFLDTYSFSFFWLDVQVCSSNCFGKTKVNQFWTVL